MTKRALLREFRIKGVQVRVFGEKDSLGENAARLAADQLRRVIAEHGRANVVFASGASQHEFLSALLGVEGVEWPVVTAFHLDEYVGMSDEHPASIRRFLRERLFDNLPFGAVHYLNGDAPDAAAESRRYETLLKSNPLDLACVGIGENGHLAFNDPPADFETRKLVHTVEVTAASRRQQVGEGQFATVDDVPRQALTLTVPAILSASIISCVVPDLRKAEAIRCTLEGPITPLCPGAALRNHEDTYLYLDTESASLLS